MLHLELLFLPAIRGGLSVLTVVAVPVSAATKRWSAARPVKQVWGNCGELVRVPAGPHLALPAESFNPCRLQPVPCISCWLLCAQKQFQQWNRTFYNVKQLGVDAKIRC